MNHQTLKRTSYRIRCAHCYKTPEEHVKGKCLYGPEQYAPLYCHGCTDALMGYHNVIQVRTTGGRYHAACRPEGLERGDYSYVETLA